MAEPNTGNSIRVAWYGYRGERAGTYGRRSDGTSSKDLFSSTARLINGLLADIKPKLATLDASSPDYDRKTSTAFFLAKAFKPL